MNKILGVIMPYIIVGIGVLMSLITMNHQIIMMSFVIGGLVGLWLLIMTKCIGTVMVKTFILVDIVILIAASIICMYIPDIEVLEIISPISALLVPIAIIGYFIINNNKPKIGMTYRYSYKNKRKRYF